MSSLFSIISIGFLAAANCGFIGSFLVLRRQAMIGDAISHAVLPGIVVAFILGKGTNPIILSIGAICSGILAMFFIGLLKEELQVRHGAAIGVVFPFFFALGVLLLAKYVPAVDLDPSCILYGDLVSAHFDRLRWAGVDLGSRAIYTLGIMLLINSLFVFVSYSTLVLISFNEDFASVVGVKTKKWNYALLLLATVNTVFIFEIIGAPLVVGFLIIPAGTACLFVRRVSSILFYTLVFDLAITLYGYLAARLLKISLVGSMITVSGLFFIFILLLVKRANKSSKLVLQKL